MNTNEKWVWENTRQDFGKWTLTDPRHGRAWIETDPRPETNKLLDKIDEGLLDPKDVVLACVKWMSEDDVADMADANEWSDRFADGPHCREEDEYDEDDGQPDEAQEWHDFDPDC